MKWVLCLSILFSLFSGNLQSQVLDFYGTDGTGMRKKIGTAEWRIPDGGGIFGVGNFDNNSKYTDFFTVWGIHNMDFYKTVGTGIPQKMGSNTGLVSSTGFIVPGNFDRNQLYTDFFVLYDHLNGSNYLLFKTDGTVIPKKIGDVQPMAQKWTHVVAGNFDSNPKYTDLFFYNKNTGKAEFYSMDGTGVLKKIGKTQVIELGWSHVLAGNFDANAAFTDLFFYNTASGISKFARTDGSGVVNRIMQNNVKEVPEVSTKPPLATQGKQPPKKIAWTHIVAGNFDDNPAYTDILFYDKVSGAAEFAKTKLEFAVPVLSLIGTRQQWEPGWKYIIAGDFDNNVKFTDLLFYHDRYIVQ